MSDNYKTDEWLLKLFSHWYDPCPYNPDYDRGIHGDGLEQAWGWSTFVNPPYSNPLPWVKKAIEEAELGKTIVMLLRHDSSTEWYRLLHEAGARFMMVQGRLKFQTERGAGFASVLAVLTNV